MSEPLQDWPRQYFKETDGKPFVFYVVYGTFDMNWEFSMSRYRSSGVPTGFDLFHYNSELNSEVLRSFQEGHVWEDIQSRDPTLASQVANSPECMVLRGEINDSNTLNYLRDCVGVLTFLLDRGGLAIYDPYMFQWWDPATWRARIFDPAAPVPTHHVVILTSEEATPDLTWIHTRGMRKFGRPELSLHNVPAVHRLAVIDLCNRFVELQAFGGVISEGQKIRMRSLPVGMTCRHGGSLDDPDFNNVHVAITFDSQLN